MTIFDSKNLIEDRDDVNIEKMLIDDEENFSRPPGSVDMVISSLNLHWINDLPKLFGNIISCLKEDGVFIGAMFGGQTLFELRCSLQMAEMDREGGFGAHVSPFVTPQDIGGLLNRAGFTMLTIDADEIVIVVHYPSIFELMYDLKGMAENNALIRARKHINRDSLLAAAAIYNGIYGKTKAVPATFQIFYFIGWKPHPSQPQPLKPGSATFSLKDIAHLGKKPNE
ncbi:PREDICTED: NADH dehydrogenase [ubiquinone] 1 alpha subcomplex assembly factor 5-like [Rhagoletis zephyria]|uniref:NADH dehydrogenase [ubiquinone] 1 alpha subcomplex assembly factor 5-like n=1 Tax=Rhagoletis zephyria TaxID=28612 RepID=UPI000811228E|nr:PREDICTED: NADH dehydrogenase [ubiquinone] 1 alpha subcomplex assembly factor 5-like [Rhagoletis zephyria]